MPPDFSSKEYWSNRFNTETSFEWLLPSERLIPYVVDTVEHLINVRLQQQQQQPGSGTGRNDVIRILHIGAGTSSLGQDVLDHFRNHPQQDVRVAVVDGDYVLPPNRTLTSSASTNLAIEAISSSTNEVPFVILDVLSPSSLLSSSPSDGWDILLDKSTSDAISCGSPLPPLHLSTPSTLHNGAGEAAIPAIIEPIERMLYSLSKVTHKYSRWISVSYSSTRYDLPTLAESGWVVVKKEFIVLPKWNSDVVDDRNTKTVVYEPETGVWVYILERQ